MKLKHLKTFNENYSQNQDDDIQIVKDMFNDVIDGLDPDDTNIILDWKIIHMNSFDGIRFTNKTKQEEQFLKSKMSGFWLNIRFDTTNFYPEKIVKFEKEMDKFEERLKTIGYYPYRYISTLTRFELLF